MVRYRMPLMFCCGLSAAFVSCVDQNNAAKTIVQPGKTDTLYVHDTVSSTRNDTIRITQGKQNPVLIGFILGDVSHDTVAHVDSLYASLTVFANPEQKSLSASFNGHALAHETGQQQTRFMSSVFDDILVFPTIAGAGYEASFRDTAKKYTVSVGLPYYASDTSKAVSLNTVVDSVRMPPKPGDLRLSFNNGVPYDSVDFFGGYDSVPY